MSLRNFSLHGAVGVFVSIFFLLAFSPNSYGYLLKDEKHGTQLSIFGVGMIRLNYAFVDGNVVFFEESEDGFAEGVDRDGFLSLMANGIIFRNYVLEGEVQYNQENKDADEDEEDREPEWYFWLKISRDRHYMMVGDQPNIFQEPYFSRYTQPFRGATLHVETDHFSVTTLGALARGTTLTEEFTPDGTSGPYTLDSIPVVTGSDIVTIEVRSQNDPRQVIEVLPQQRNIDYTIDYDTGEITFADPIERETFQGDPLAIVVIYKTAETSAAFSTGLLGARTTVTPGKWLTVGATYVSEFDREPSFSDGFDRRQEIYGVDSTVTLGEALRLTTEYAFSRDYQDEANDTGINQALHAELAGQFGKSFELRGTYHRTDRDFLTFANPAIDPDEQNLDIAGTYSYHAGHTLTLGYKFLQDNLPRDSAEPTTTTHTPYLDWEAVIREQTKLYAKYELTRTTDDQNPKVADKTTNTYLVGGIQDFLSVPLLKKLSVKAEYQLRDFEDQTDQAADTLTHQGGLRLTAEPANKVSFYVQQRERLIYDQDLRENTERQDISEIGLDLDRWERFTWQTKYEYRAAYDLLVDERESEQHTLILRSKYQPFSVLTAMGKLEWRDETRFALDAADDDSTSRKLNLEGRLFYTPKKDFSVRVRYEYQQAEDTAAATTTTREDTAEVRLNYAFDQRRTRLTGLVKMERDLLDAPPTPETETRTMTYLASIGRQLTDRWDALVQYKRETVEVAAHTARDDVFAELGSRIGRFLKGVLGYQYTNFQDDDTPTNDHTAHSVYLKMIGKL